jgi:lysophospholipase L1-like esterase
MTDQIIDKRTVAIPGPASTVPGPPGLPGVNAVPADQAVAAYVSDRSSATFKALRWRGCDTMVTFGDSMTVTGSTQAACWEFLVGAALGLRVRNYGVGGMGFLNGGTTYGVQLDNALADSGVDRSKVRYVIVNGSTNDIGRNTDDLYAAASDWAARVKAAYPNADYIALSTLCGANVRWIDRANDDRLADLMPQIRAVSQALSMSGFQVIGNAHLWLLYNTQYSQSDGLHPNDQGHQVIARNVVQALSGITPTTPWHSGGNKTNYNTMSFSSASTPLPLDGTMSTGFYNYTILPSSAQYFISIQLFLTLKRSDVLRWATHTTKNSNGDITGVQGIELPVARKLLPMRVNDQHPEICSWPAPETRINNTYGAIVQNFRSKNTDRRLSSPNDARNLLWLNLDTIPYLDSSGSNRIYNMLDAGDNLQITAAGRIIGSMEGGWR